MSRKSKIDALEKVKIVEQYLDGEISQKGSAKACGVNKRSVKDWIRIYETEGPEGLLTPKTNKRYSKDLKLQAVQAYLSGEGSLNEICARFGSRQHVQRMSWIKVYNEGKEFKELTGGSTMKKVRKTILEEQIAIVKDCLSHNRNYGAMALKYNCSYQQVRNWVDCYEKIRSTGLEGRRRKRAGFQTSRTSEEELRNRIAELERKSIDPQMEDGLLKK